MRSCDCESAKCEKSSDHEVGNCHHHATVMIKIFGMWEYLCDQCFYAVDTNHVEQIINLRKGDAE